MEALDTRVVQVLFSEITLLNGETTEEDLNMLISEEIASDRLSCDTMEVYDEAEGIVSTEELNSSDSVYVYIENGLEDWSFDEYNNIDDAIRAATLSINAKVICKGQVIKYDIISDKEAYYIDNETGEAKVVKL